MQFPNAYTGVKKIFTAEILSIIATVLVLIAAVAAVGVAYAGEASDSSGGGAVALVLVCTIAFLIISIISFFMNLSGLRTASQDEPNFQTALIFAVVSIVATVISNVITSSEALTGILDILSDVATVLATYFVIRGIMALAEKLNNQEVAGKGNTVIILVFAAFALSLISSILGTYVLAETPAAVLSLISLIFSLVQYIVYLVFLSNGKKMLAAGQAEAPVVDYSAEQ